MAPWMYADVYAMEMQRQAELARALHEDILNTVNAADGFRAFGLVQQLLMHVTQAIRVAYAPPGADQGKARTRRRWMRVALRVDAPEWARMNHPFRNDVVHFDERLDAFLLADAAPRPKEEAKTGRVYASAPRFDGEFGRRTGNYFRIVHEGRRTDARFVISGNESAACSLLEVMAVSTEIAGHAEAYLDGDALRQIGRLEFMELVQRADADIDAAEALAFGR